MIRRPPRSTPFPYPTLSQSLAALITTQLGQTAWAGRRSPLVLATAAGSLAVLVAVVQTPGLSRFFGCRPLDPVSWLTVLGWAAVGTATGEVAPALIERFRRTRPEEDTMTEQPSPQQQPDDDESG